MSRAAPVMLYDKSGGPAFPTKNVMPQTINGRTSFIMTGPDGMSLHDWYAGQFLSCVATLDCRKEEIPFITSYAFAFADAMIHERAKRLSAEITPEPPKLQP